MGDDEEAPSSGKVGCLRPAQTGKASLFCHNTAPPLGKLRVILPLRGVSVLILQTLATMAQWEDFNLIFSFNKKYSYDSKTVDQIVSNRRALENRLFADRLLGLLGIKGGKLETNNCIAITNN